MTFEIDYAYACHVGKVRANNEDNFWCCGHFLPVQNKGLEAVRRGSKKKAADLPVLAVFDGMGGESCGEVAAHLAAEALDRYYQRQKEQLRRDGEKFVKEACLEMDRAVCAYGKENCIAAMGTTLAMLAFTEKGIYACNLGDSRIYRESGGSFMQISTDHTLGGARFRKAPLTRYLGPREEELAPEPALRRLPYPGQSQYLLCSDGITDMLSEVELASILSRGEEPEAAVERILNLALEKGGRDNATVVLCRVREKRREDKGIGWIRKIWRKHGSSDARFGL